MIKIGLTGGIASGKSSISAHLSGIGAYVIDADKIARLIMRGDVLQRVRAGFGDEYFFADGTLDRKKLASTIFSDYAARKFLEGITLPAILHEIERQLLLAEQSGLSAAIVDAPTLIESGAYKLVNEIWLINAGTLQTERLMARDGISYEQAQARIASQMPYEEKLPYATHIIDNTKTLEAAQRQAEELWQSAISKARK